MSEKHTPGPWIWGADFRGLYGAGPDNEVLSHASYEGMWLAHGDSREANARLIAAAPDLLEALQAVDNVSRESDSALTFSLAMDRIIDQIRAAIGKATEAA